MSGKRTNGRIAHTKWKNPRRKYALDRMWGAHDAFELRAEFAHRRDIPFTYWLKTMYSAKRVFELTYPASLFFRMIPEDTTFT